MTITIQFPHPMEYTTTLVPPNPSRRWGRLSSENNATRVVQLGGAGVDAVHNGAVGGRDRTAFYKWRRRRANNNTTYRRAPAVRAADNVHPIFLDHHARGWADDDVLEPRRLAVCKSPQVSHLANCDFPSLEGVGGSVQDVCIRSRKGHGDRGPEAPFGVIAQLKNSPVVALTLQSVTVLALGPGPKPPPPPKLRLESSKLRLES